MWQNINFKMILVIYQWFYCSFRVYDQICVHSNGLFFITTVLLYKNNRPYDLTKPCNITLLIITFLTTIDGLMIFHYIPTHYAVRVVVVRSTLPTYFQTSCLQFLWNKLRDNPDEITITSSKLQQSHNRHHKGVFTVWVVTFHVSNWWSAPLTQETAKLM